jgi:hypothetical protein
MAKARYRYPKTQAEYEILAAEYRKRPTLLIHLQHNRHPKMNQPLFRNQPPEVRVEARKALDELLVIHAHDLNSRKWKARNYYYAILVATATMMAKRRLGLTPTTWSDAARLTIKTKIHKSKLKTFLGLQEPSKGDPSLPIYDRIKDGWRKRKLKANQSQAIHDNHGEIPKCEVRYLEEAFDA